jgi:dienelactone hydrolase
MKIVKGLMLSVLVSIACSYGYGQSDDPAWSRLRPYFSPPEIFQRQYGNLRSPLRFYDGREVKSKKDWAVRRQEIRTRWMALMGPWPDLISHPQYSLLDSSLRENFIQYKIRFYWRPDETTDGYLLIPLKKGKKPAVITVFYEPETAIGLRKPFVDFAYQLARKGFVTLSIGTPAVSKEKPFAQYYPDYDHATVQPLSMLACLSANAWHLLADRPEVDSTRIGIMGHSYGSKWAMFSSCLFDKFACAVWSDGGVVFDRTRPNVNYWDPWYLGYTAPPPPDGGGDKGPDSGLGLYPKLIAGGYDLQELQALMAPRPFLVSGGSEDGQGRWVVLNHAVAVNQLLGYGNRVGMTNRPDHTPTSASNEIAFLFFQYFLQDDGLKTR